MSDPNRRHLHVVDEAIAEAGAEETVNIVVGAVFQFQSNLTSMGQFLESVSFAGAEADRIMSRGWDFLGRRRDAA
ncbi:MAG: hypothetical protein ACR2MN_09030 [Acidimicrobiales bacterium]